MDPWSIGLIAVLVVGVAVILYGALADRAKTKRAAQEVLAPPKRDIPQFHPDSPAPSYLSELQARRVPETVRPVDLTAAERDQLARQVKEPGTVRIGTGFASRDFVTDQGSSQAILDDPRVLVCAERIESTRELLGLLERLVLSRTPLVVVAPSLSDEVRSTLEVNQLQGRMRLLAVTPSAADLQRLAQATGADPRTREDLQAGYIWPEHLGSCARWVSNAKASFVVGPSR